jgi:hypothetical protein
MKKLIVASSILLSTHLYATLNYPVQDFRNWDSTYNPFKAYYDVMGGYHPGVDISLAGKNDVGKNVYPIAEGTIYRIIPFKSTIGGAVVMKHIINGKTYYSVYYHINPKSYLTKDKIPVKTSTAIGTVGNITSFGPHLHLEVRTKMQSDLYPNDRGGLQAGYYTTKALIDTDGYIDPIAFIENTTMPTSDTTKPTASITNLNGKTITQGTSSIATYISASDNKALSKIRLQVVNASGSKFVDQPWYNSSTSFGISFNVPTSSLAANTYYYTLFVVDAAGNLTQTQGTFIVSGATLSSIGVTCSSTTLNANQTSTCYAKAYYSNGKNKNVTSTTTTSWSSSNPSVASVSSSGIVTAKTVGSTSSATIRATYTEGGKTLYGSTNITVNKSIQTTDNKPTITINTSGSSSSNNPKNSNFTLSASATDDKGLQYIGYTIYNTSNGSVIKSNKQRVSGTSNSANFTINTGSLSDGSYKILVVSVDNKNQASDYQYYYFQKSTVDNKPTITINTSGSSSSNNPKNSNFTLSVTSQDDKGLSKVAYAVLTSSGSRTYVKEVKNISGTSNTNSFSINISSLSSGSYKIAVGVSDNKGQSSNYQYYYFQKR